MKWYRSSGLLELGVQEGRRKAKGNNRKRGERIGEKLSRCAYPLACAYAYHCKRVWVFRTSGLGRTFE